jgi:hypothetical protein
MMAVEEEEEDTTTTMAADQGRKSGQVLEGRVAAFIYRHTFSPGSCNKP